MLGGEKRTKMARVNQLNLAVKWFRYPEFLDVVLTNFEVSKGDAHW